MVYEIFFDPKGAVWRIRITTYVLAVLPVAMVVQERVPNGEDGPSSATSLTPMAFDTYQAATEYCDTVGLDNVYRLRNRKDSYGSVLNAEAAHAAS